MRCALCAVREYSKVSTGIQSEGVHGSVREENVAHGGRSVVRQEAIVRVLGGINDRVNQDASLLCTCR